MASATYIRGVRVIPSRRRRPAAFVVLALLGLMLKPASAQDSGSDWAIVAGGALGLYSGAVLGMAGGMIPCSQTYAGASCVRLVGISGGAIGLASGLYLGAEDEDRVVDALRGAGYGLLIGSAAGFTLSRIVPYYGWLDVVAGGGIGAAVGASAEGAVIGLAVGTVVGTVLWRSVPSFELPDAVGVAVMGLAVGGLATWVIRAVEAGGDRTSAQSAILSVSLKI